MARLKEIQKRYIVQRLACWDTPSEVAEAVKLEFGIDLHRAHVQAYDPTSVHGAKLGKPLRELFHETRQEFKRSTESIPVAQRSYRLAELQKMADKAKRMGNLVLAADIMERAAKETGDYWTNKRELSGPGGGPVEQSGTLTVRIVDPQSGDE